MTSQINWHVINAKSINAVAGAVLLIGIAVSLIRQSDSEAKNSSESSVQEKWVRQSLSPVENPDPDAINQPFRLKPFRLVISEHDKKSIRHLTGKRNKSRLRSCSS